MTTPQEDAELRKQLNDFLRQAMLTDGTVNPNTLNTLERFIKARDGQREREIAEKVINKLIEQDAFSEEYSVKQLAHMVRASLANPQEQDKEEE